MKSRLVLTTLLIAWSSWASAVVISLEPASQPGTPGATVSLDLVASGVGPLDNIGEFDVDVLFDAAALSFVGHTLGSGLGDPFFGEALDLTTLTVPGVLNVAALSFLENDAGTCSFCIPPFLEDLQGSGPVLTLATLDFFIDVLAPGSSTFLDVAPGLVVGDGFGDTLSPITGPPAEIFNPGGTVPAPGAALLAALALLGIWLRARPALARR